MLDEIFGGRPAFFSDAFSHNAWVSSRALELAGVGPDTPDPAQGIIVRDSVSGEPTVTLRDSAMGLIESLIPEVPLDERYE